jgi:hypothetical protein
VIAVPKLRLSAVSPAEHMTMRAINYPREDFLNAEPR